jgi:hypothetical protein
MHVLFDNNGGTLYQCQQLVKVFFDNSMQAYLYFQITTKLGKKRLVLLLLPTAAEGLVDLHQG